MLISFFAVSISQAEAHDGQPHPPGVSVHPADASAENDPNEHARTDEYWAEQAQDMPPFDAAAALSRMVDLPSHIGGEWGPVTTWPHIPVTAAVVPDGRVVTFASNQRTRFPGGQPEQTYTAVWDPDTNVIEEIFYEGHDMFCGHPVMLEDGLMMVSGGRNQANSPWTSTYDFRTNSWSAQQNMNYGRWYPTSVALPDGGVFIGNGVGGQNTGEVWSPDDGWRVLPGINFSPLSNVGAPEDNMWPWFVVGASGNVEHIGPHHDMHTISTAGNGSMTYSAEFDDSWYPNSGSIVGIDAGRFLVSGGNSSYTNNTASYNASIVDVNVSPPVVTDIASMNLNRHYANPVMLPTGELLIVGGKSNRGRFEDSGTHLEPELYDPVNDTWTLLNPMDVPRNYHSVGLLMQDGRVFVGGGGLCGCAGDHQDVQIYSPPYLFNPDGSLATRPTITAHPELATTGQTVDVSASAGMAKFSLIKLSATTHAVNTDQRFLDVPFTETTPGQYALTLDNNINVMTPGYWMLFAVDSQGVPSEAMMVQIKHPSRPLANLALGKPTAQSSTLPSAIDFVAENAVDGNLNGNHTSKSLTHTQNDAQAWWEVDLGDVYDLDEITVWNRTDCCANRLTDFHVFVSDTPFSSQSLAATQAQAGVSDFHFPSTAGRETDFAINRTGRYVRVQLSGTNFLQLAEVQIFGAPIIPNTPPTIAPIPNQLNTTGESVNYMLDVADVDDDPLTITVVGLPPSVSFDAANILLTGDVTQKGIYPVTITADDGEDSVSAEFIWFVSVVGEADTVTVSQATANTWHTVNLDYTYRDPVVVMGPTSFNNTDPLTLRVRNVTTDSFQFQLDEWDYLDGTHGAEQVAYMVVEAGTHTLAGGLTLQAGHTTATDAWSSTTFDAPFGGTPTVLSQVTTVNEAAAVTTRLRNVAANGFDLMLNEQELDGPHAAETVAWIAIEHGTVNNIFEVGVTPNSVTDAWYTLNFAQLYSTPIFLADDQTTDGSDPTSLRYRNLTGSSAELFVEEEMSANAETLHATEVVGYLVLEDGDVPLQPSSNVAPSITQLADQQNTAGDAVFVPVLAGDLNDDTLDYAATNLPTGLVINSVTGHILGTPTVAGTFSVLVTVDDGNGGSDSMSFSWVVNEAASLTLDPIQTTPHAVGAVVNFAASASGGNGTLQYRWLFGDGSAETPSSTSPNATHTYASAGRYNAQVTVTDASGQSVSHIFYQAIHDPLTANRPNVSSQIVYETRIGADRVWNVNPDNDTVSVIDTATNGKSAEINVGSNPRSLAIAPDGNVWVTNRRSATITVIDVNLLLSVNTLPLPYASQPGGIVFAPDGSAAFIALEATGQIIKLDATTGLVIETLDVGAAPRHLSINGAGDKLYVSRFITPPLPGEETDSVQTEVGGQPVGGEVLVIDPVAMTFDNTIVLRHSNEPNAEVSGSGIPNYLGAPVIDPGGLSAWVPSKQDNITQGTLRNGQELDFDHTVRSIGSQIILGTESEDYPSRVDFDNAGVASAAAFGQFGNYLFVALETNREVAVVDPYIDQTLMRIDVGFAPQGVVVSADNQTLYVHNFMSRSVTVIDISTLISNGTLVANVVTTVDVVDNETLATDVLTGKVLFYDARDTRLAQDSYMSCASCHNDGDGDGRTWDFTQFGEGLRNTISLQGHANQGVVHWSGNFDEIHDFENQIRDFAGGTGLMSDADFNSGTVSDPLGDPKAGLSADLDALNAYVLSLDTVGNSPFRQFDGSLTADGVAGRDLFLNEGCVACHSGNEFTDSALDVRHDVGTILPSSGGRLGVTLDGLDTPTLRGLWNNAPYLHDGSAETLADAVNAHNGVSLTAGDMADLTAFLQQIDANEPAPTVPFSCTPGVLHEWWDGIPGVYVVDLTSHPDYPTQPTGSEVLSSFRLPPHTKNEYGVRIRGYLIAPETGSYTFWIASDDEGELWLSTDDNPANATRIAHVVSWTNPETFNWYPQQQSVSINLVAGERYYIEALMKEWWGGDHVSVAWQTPSSPQAVITDADLCTVELSGSAPTADIVTDIDNGTIPLNVNFDATGSVDTDGSIVSYEWTFGDGSTASGSTVSYTYLNAGVFDVTLTVTDDDGRADVATTSITANVGAVSCAETGLTYDRFDDSFGGTVADLLNDPRYPDSPDSTQLLVDFEAPTNVGDYYGGRAYGYLMPPVTGAYTFWLASDDSGTLRLSSDSNPGNAVEIASVSAWAPPQQWDWYPEQKSAEINLVAGETYFVEAIFKENGGGDNLAVAWQIPGGARQLVPSVVLCPAVDNGSAPVANIVATPPTGDAPLSVVFDGTGSADADGPLASYAWDFGDGATATGPTANHVYTNAGTYAAMLTVTDGDGRTNTTTTLISVTTPGGGVACNTNGVRYERWDGVWSDRVAVLLQDSRYPDSPTSVNAQPNFVVPSNVGDIYGARMRAYLIAPETGSYTFWVASDNEGQLWLSTDTLPSNATLIAQADWSPEQNWDYLPSQESIEITLAAGQAYYIEGLHQTSWGSDYYAVAWQTPSGARELLPQSVLCEYEVAGRTIQPTAGAAADSYAIPSFGASPIFSTLPADLYPELMMILTADQTLRAELFMLLDQYRALLAGDEVVSAEFVAEATQVYDGIYDNASPALQAWLLEHWTRLNGQTLAGMTARTSWDVVNALVPTGVQMQGQSATQAVQLWHIVLLLIGLLFVTYRRVWRARS